MREIERKQKKKTVEKVIFEWKVFQRECIEGYWASVLRMENEHIFHVGPGHACN